MDYDDDEIAGIFSPALVPFVEDSTPFNQQYFQEPDETGAQCQFDGLANQRVLVVGAGALGCEALKSLVMSGFLDITVVDMDTIELSNLNRQFMFREKDIGRFKSTVAAEFTMARRPEAKITPEHCKIQAFGKTKLRDFTLVVLCLDNMEARLYINEVIRDNVEYLLYKLSISQLLEVLDHNNKNIVTPQTKKMKGLTQINTSLYATLLSQLFTHYQYSQSFQKYLQTHLSQNPSNCPIFLSQPLHVNQDTISEYYEGGTEGWRGHYRALHPTRTFCLQCTQTIQTSIQNDKQAIHTHLCTIANVPRIPEHCIMYVHQLLWPKLIYFNDRNDYEIVKKQPKIPPSPAGSDIMSDLLHNDPAMNSMHDNDERNEIDLDSFEEDPASVEFDSDNIEHIYWILDRACERADQFNIPHPTYAQTLGVIKNTIPAISSTNSLIASLCVDAAFHSFTSTVDPYRTYDLTADNTSKFEGQHILFTSDNYNTGVGIVTNLLNKRTDCPICRPRIRVSVTSETPLFYIIHALMMENWFGNDIRNIREAINVELIDLYQDDPSKDTIAMFKGSNAIDNTESAHISKFVNSLIQPVGFVLKQKMVYKLNDLNKSKVPIRFDIEFIQ